MTIVTSYDWESDTFTHHGDNGARQAWREAVVEIADKAKATLPECNGRVDKAVAIVLNGDVELLADGKAKVASQSNGTTTYFVVNGECQCKDFPKAPSQWCKRLCTKSDSLSGDFVQVVLLHKKVASYFWECYTAQMEAARRIALPSSDLRVGRITAFPRGPMLRTSCVYPAIAD